MKTPAIFLVFFVFGALKASTQVEQSGSRDGDAQNLSGIHEPYIIGGDLVIGRQFPGMISLQIGGVHRCGGSIVNANYTVTAAHYCQFDPKDMIVMSGSNQLETGGTDHNVLQIHSHEHYNHSDPSTPHDICVLKVDPPFIFDNYTATVTLPQQGHVTPAGTPSIIVGWGITEEGEMSEDLRMIKVPIFDHEECKRRYQRVNITLIPEQICSSSGEGKGYWKGDSGGPLFVNNELIGIMSMASGKADERWPGILTRVSAYVDWINLKVKS